MSLAGRSSGFSSCYLGPVGIVLGEDGSEREKGHVDNTDQDCPGAQFEAHRAHLRSVAYRMLGSLSEADDAGQEAWLRLARSDSSAVLDLRGWPTTGASRVCLASLRSRGARREDPLEVRLPDPVVTAPDDDPQQQ